MMQKTHMNAEYACNTARSVPLHTVHFWPLCAEQKEIEGNKKGLLRI